MSEIDISQVLAQMRVISAKVQAGIPLSVAEEPSTARQVSFDKLLAESINMVSRTQSDAKAVKTAFQSGTESVTLPEVMIAVQKASISFEAMTQVRNKLLTAYQEIMNMQV